MTTENIRIFIGSDRSQKIAADVLSHSIRINTNRNIKIVTSEVIDIPEPRDLRQTQRTGFSFARWGIPQYYNYSGKAIYVDADMLVFSDIEELWSRPQGDAIISIVDGRDTSYCSKSIAFNKNESSVMLIDCEKAEWKLETLVAGLDGQYEYKDLMSDLCFLNESDIDRSVPRTWNSMDFWNNEVKLLHYTNVPTQPWVSLENPYGSVWVDYLKQLIEKGYMSEQDVTNEVTAGYVRPSLLSEVKGKTAGPDDLSYIATLKAQDKKAGYIPHREVMAWTAKRAKAIARYEAQLAKTKGMVSYIRHVSNIYVSKVYVLTRALLSKLKFSY
jgi:lipopolysaccharide biosynthesis glycosyltransferase